ncbi:EthD family reductase [Acidisphaera sp. S103]|uniref:EthD family reductase n=1 Tax=Acidisphaera sp. S103 TaxID=1747223 RepID=UPI001C209CA8|nr:EthD family reductase [Acidisphaera sp. S103]
MIVSVMYQVGPGHKFDLDYYMKTHVPLVGRLWGSSGLKGAQVLQGAGSPSGDPAMFHIIALLDFESLDAFKSAAAAHGKEVLGDIPNFTDVQPTIQFNDRLA